MEKRESQAPTAASTGYSSRSPDESTGSSHQAISTKIDPVSASLVYNCALGIVHKPGQ